MFEKAREKPCPINWEKDFGIEVIKPSKCSYVVSVWEGKVNRIYHQEYAFKCLDEDITNDKDVKQILEKIEKVELYKSFYPFHQNNDVFFDFDFRFSGMLKNINFSLLNDNKDTVEIDVLIRGLLGSFGIDEKPVMVRRVDWERRIVDDFEIGRRVSSFYSRGAFSVVNKDVEIIDGADYLVETIGEMKKPPEHIEV